MLKKINFFLLLISTVLGGCQINPDGLRYESNFLKGLEAGAELQRPILIHFTSYGCMGYDEFNNDLIRSKDILRTLNADYVTILLYVDDKKGIQGKDSLNLHKIAFTTEGKESIKKARTIGQINATIETDLFKNNTQPLYVISDSKGKILVEPFGYTGKDKAYFLAKLQEGLNAYYTSRR